MIEWNTQLVLELIEYEMYVLNSGHHDENRFKGTIIYSENDEDRVGEVKAFNKSDFKALNAITITFEN